MILKWIETVVFAETCNKEVCASRLRKAPPGSSGAAPPPLSGTSMQNKRIISILQNPVSTSAVYDVS